MYADSHAVSRVHRPPDLVNEAPEPEEQGVLRLHVIAGCVCAVVVLAGQPWCAVTHGPDGEVLLAFAEDVP